MKLNLYWRGRDVIDVELHVWRRRFDGDVPPPIEATAGGSFERSEPMGEPDTSIRIGFGSTLNL